MRSKDVGEIAEIEIAAEMIRSGYTVSRPMNDTKYDLVAENGGEFVRVQVKAGRMKNGCVRATLCEYNGGEAYIYTAEDIDMFAVYEEEYGCFFIPYQESPEQMIHIRVEEPDHDSALINYGEDYRAEEKL